MRSDRHISSHAFRFDILPNLQRIRFHGHLSFFASERLFLLSDGVNCSLVRASSPSEVLVRKLPSLFLLPIPTSVLVFCFHIFAFISVWTKPCHCFLRSMRESIVFIWHLGQLRSSITPYPYLCRVACVVQCTVWVMEMTTRTGKARAERKWPSRPFWEEWGQV
jgi:hypothetical protein